MSSADLAREPELSEVLREVRSLRRELSAERRARERMHEAIVDEVLRLVAEGLTNPEIGSRLYLSRHTVKEYLSHAMRKLDAANRIDAVRRATALGLIAGVSPPAREHGGETLVYNESGSPVGSSDLKVPPLKLDQLQAAPKRP
jgi:DNA-binding CsgD family transcriptional regulator